MKAKCSFENSENNYPVMWCHVPEKNSPGKVLKKSKINIMTLK